MGKTAILVDGAFYRKQAEYLFGEKTPEDRANELIEYCMRHLREKDYNGKNYSYRELYRIFYYDCLPSEKTIYNPITKKSESLKKTKQYAWSNQFFDKLSNKRKVALRMGELLESSAGYELRPEALKRLCSGELRIEDLQQEHLVLDIKQKGVDMRIGLDIASLSHKGLVDQIVLIAGDSDFVPAAKYARREGIDFILDPMYHTIKPSLIVHVDGLQSKTKRPPENKDDHLCVK